MKNEVEINPNIILASITRAGYNVDEFVNSNPKVKIQSWIEGTKKPTFKQLEAFSKKVYLPFGYFFLDELPNETLSFPFFRTNQKGTPNISLNVYDTVTTIQQRQSWLKDYFNENGMEENLPFVGKYKNNLNIEEIVNDIRKTLELKVNWTSFAKNWEEAILQFTKNIESKGIITVFNGVVDNNNDRKISVEECRGFVLVDDIAPFMFINNDDSKSAQMFTMAHELAHIWVGQSAGFDNNHLLPADDPIEILCDKIAAELLVPQSEFLSFWSSTPDIYKASSFFKVSRLVIARRALDTGVWTKPQYFSFYNSYTKNEKTKSKESTGGNFYFTTRKRLSPTFAQHVNNAVISGSLLYRDAYKLTSLKGNTFHTFVSEYLA